MVNKQQLKRIEIIALSILLYGVVLIYIYQFLQITGKYKPWTTDEFFYYTEAKAIAAYNNYQTPASLDGNTSYIGDFGFHGASYAIKDGWLAKLFFHTQDPPLLWNNFLTCIITLTLILLFKPLSLDKRLKIALVVATHYILYSYTLSYMQETIHYLLAVLALIMLYSIYQRSDNVKTNYLFYYLLIISIAITFRYGWFIWGLALLPLSTDIKSFIKWCLVILALLVFGVFISRYIASPYPYDSIMADRLIRVEKFSLFNSISIVVNKFIENLTVFLTPAESDITTCMRYLLVFLLIANTVYAIIKRNKFTIACVFVTWAYFFAALAFYWVHWAYDERMLAILTPILSFSLIGINNSWLFYLIMAVQLFVFPNLVEETSARVNHSIAINEPTPEKILREESYSKMKDLITDDGPTVVSVGVGFVLHGTTDYFTKFPLVNSKGYPIHYRMFLKGMDIRNTHHPKYVMSFDAAPPTEPNELVYADKWMHFYRILN